MFNKLSFFILFFFVSSASYADLNTYKQDCVNSLSKNFTALINKDILDIPENKIMMDEVINGMCSCSYDGIMKEFSESERQYILDSSPSDNIKNYDDRINNLMMSCRGQIDNKIAKYKSTSK